MTIGKMHSSTLAPERMGWILVPLKAETRVFLADEFHHYHAETKKYRKIRALSWEKLSKFYF